MRLAGAWQGEAVAGAGVGRLCLNGLIGLHAVQHGMLCRQTSGSKSFFLSSGSKMVGVPPDESKQCN